MDRRLLLLVDNVDLVLERVGQEQEWEFRRVLSEEKRLTIVGASSRAIESFYEHGRAFYDYFQVHELKGLEDGEAFALLRHLSAALDAPEVERLIAEQPGRVKALRLLTGGNPRTLVLLFQVLQRGADGDIQRDLEHLLDLYTPLYKARFEELPAQAQQVVDAMAIHWDPLTAADVAELTGLPVNGAPAQLKRLDDLGVVEKVPWFGEKKAGFQIAERFFNIWYLMRASRRVRRRLVWLVKFMQAWFSAEELRERAQSFLGRETASDPERYAELSFAYAQAEDQRLQRQLEHAGLRVVMADDVVRRTFDFSDLPQTVLDRRQHMDGMRELAGSVAGARGDWGGVDPGEFGRLLCGSPYYDLVEKRRVVAGLGELPAGEVVALYEQLADDERRLRGAYGADADRLLAALSSGEMTDAFDWISAPSGQVAHVGVQSRVHVSLGRLRPGDLERAEMACLEMREEPDFAPHGWLGWGLLLTEHFGRHEEAERAYRRSSELDPKGAWAWNNLGHLLADRPGRHEEAERAYRRAIELGPKFAWTWNNLGKLLKNHLARFDEAEQAYRRAIELDQNFARPWHNLGCLLADDLGRHEEAARAYRRAIELDPMSDLKWRNLGLLLSRHLGRHEEAEQAFRHAIELEPTSDMSWTLLGALLTDHFGRHYEAVLAYRRAIEINPSEPWPWIRLSAVLADHLDKWDQAEEPLRRAIELDPSLGVAWSGLGRLLAFRLGRPEDAEGALRRAIELEPEDTASWSDLGYLLSQDDGRLAEAAAASLRAVQLDASRTGDVTRLLRAIQWVARQPDRSAAEGLARQAADAPPGNGDVAFLLAEVLVRVSKWREARPIVERLASDSEAEPGTYATGFCAAAVEAGHTGDLVELFVETGAAERWRPLYEALRAVQSGSALYLRRVAPEVRHVAERLLRQIAPGLSGLS